MRKLVLILCAFFPLVAVQAQRDTMNRVYNVKTKYELPAGGACIILSSLGFAKLQTVSAMTMDEVLRLNPADVNAFDRPIIFKDPAGFKSAEKTSNLFLNISIAAPALFALDKKIRKDWLDLLGMYLVTHAVDNALYFVGTYSVRRPRPLTYNTSLDIKERYGEGKSNSFYSGHVGFSSAATFFAAKVYTDYHRIKGWKRMAIYAAAAVPPALVGYFRMQAGRHFKTDVLVGFISGAASGILVPELHRIKKKYDQVSLAPYYVPGAGGITVGIGIGGLKKTKLFNTAVTSITTGIIE